MKSKIAVGIDLGTTNCVLAWTEPGESPAPPERLPIPQRVSGDAVESRTTLPSFLYLPTDAEKASELAPPDFPSADYVVGEWARRRSAEAAQRTVSAAKSWLCHSRVDRRQPILPWNAPPEVAKVSPVEASRRYLAHLAAAWNLARPDDPLSKQNVVLTVPASFDAGARELTREAALAAGLPEDLVLLEEPQAAVYAWLADQGSRWRRKLKLGDRLLVCDVGGGTTDFTLVEVRESGGDLVLERLAVGDHVLVGGDNMDLALAHKLQGALAKQGAKLDAWQSVSLWHACRAAKEAVLGEGGPKSAPVTVQGRGARLIAKAVTVELSAAEAESFLLDGFFPVASPDDRPQRGPAVGFQELGLPYEQDPAVTRHLAAFLAAHEAVGDRSPTHVLFNGGAFKAKAFRQRLLEVLAGWAGREVKDLAPRSTDLDHSVARGAAHYAVVRQGKGIRIRGGTARAYYVGIELAAPAIPGAPRPLAAQCVAPYGMEEGTDLDVPMSEVGVMVGRPARFRFFSSPVRKTDAVGARLMYWDEDELQETDPLETTLPAADLGSAAERGPAGDAKPAAFAEVAPVRFRTRLTELGVLELYCVSTRAPEQSWKLEFSVRSDGAEGPEESAD